MVKKIVQNNIIKNRHIVDIKLEGTEIADENVRHLQQARNLEELKTSIQRIGLIHPILLVPSKAKGKKWEILVGQRRFLAFSQLHQKTIPAITIDDLDPISKKIVSFTENIHRRDLPYDDTIKICDELFKRYKGAKGKRIEQISKEIGIPPQTISRYLSYRLVPNSVQNLVVEGKLTKSQAFKMTTAFWPNAEKIEKIAKYTIRMPGSDWQKALDIGRKNPEASMDEILKEDSKFPPRVKYSITLNQDVLKILDKKAKEIGKLQSRPLQIQDLILQIIDEFIEREGVL